MNIVQKMIILFLSLFTFYNTFNPVMITEKHTVKNDEYLYQTFAISGNFSVEVQGSDNNNITVYFCPGKSDRCNWKSSLVECNNVKSCKKTLYEITGFYTLSMYPMKGPQTIIYNVIYYRFRDKVIGIIKQIAALYASAFFVALAYR